ncbi:MAG: transposase [Ferrimicrobium sp.]
MPHARPEGGFDSGSQHLDQSPRPSCNHPQQGVSARSSGRNDYRITRPKVERKFAHLMRRKHGLRRVRVRGLLRVGNDFSLLAGGENLA